MQHPPFELFGQLAYPAVHVPSSSPQVSPEGQQPTPEETETHVWPDGQQRSEPIELHETVSAGHWKARAKMLERPKRLKACLSWLVCGAIAAESAGGGIDVLVASSSPKSQ